jgi:hypothetical protein
MSGTGEGEGMGLYLRGVGGEGAWRCGWWRAAKAGGWRLWQFLVRG